MNTTREALVDDCISLGDDRIMEDDRLYNHSRLTSIMERNEVFRRCGSRVNENVVDRRRGNNGIQPNTVHSRHAWNGIELEDREREKRGIGSRFVRLLRRRHCILIVESIEQGEFMDM